MLTDLEDHAVGLELQLVELVEQQERARVQHRDRDAAAFEPEITELQQELIATAECAARPAFGRPQVLAPEAVET